MRQVDSWMTFLGVAGKVVDKLKPDGEGFECQKEVCTRHLSPAGWPVSLAVLASASSHITHQSSPELGAKSPIYFLRSPAAHTAPAPAASPITY